MGSLVCGSSASKDVLVSPRRHLGSRLKAGLYHRRGNDLHHWLQMHRKVAFSTSLPLLLLLSGHAARLPQEAVQRPDAKAQLPEGEHASAAMDLAAAGSQNSDAVTKEHSGTGSKIEKHGARRVLLDWPLSRREQQHQKTRELARKHRLERSHRRKQRQEGIENSIQNSANKIAAALKEDKERKQAEESLKSLGQQYSFDVLSQFRAKRTENFTSSFSEEGIAAQDAGQARLRGPKRKSLPHRLDKENSAVDKTAALARGKAQAQALSHRQAGPQQQEAARSGSAAQNRGSESANAVLGVPEDGRVAGQKSGSSTERPGKNVSQSVAAGRKGGLIELQQPSGVNKLKHEPSTLPASGKETRGAAKGALGILEPDSREESWSESQAVKVGDVRRNAEQQIAGGQPQKGSLQGAKESQGGSHIESRLRGFSPEELLRGAVDTTGLEAADQEDDPNKVPNVFVSDLPQHLLGKQQGAHKSQAGSTASELPSGAAGQQGQIDVVEKEPQAGKTSLTMATGKDHKGVSEEEWRERQAVIVQTCKETWQVYEQYAMGFDELAPISLTGKNGYGGLGAMVIDSLDTLWMFGLQDEYQRAKNWVASGLTLNANVTVSFFETTIRIVGGLLSAFDLTNERLFLDKALALSEKLMVACPESNVLCTNSVHLNDPEAQAEAERQAGFGTTSLAEFGSIQMEFVTLSKRTGVPAFGQKAEAMIRQIYKAQPDAGLLPLEFSRQTGLPVLNRQASVLTVGAMADSYYEYLLKMWLLGNKTTEMYRHHWELAVDDALENLTGTSPDGLFFISSRIGDFQQTAMEHLACFFPGNIALGVMEGAVADSAKAARYLEAAEKLTFSCWQMYERTASGLGLEIGEFSQMTPQMTSPWRGNRLRPETVESFFYLWRATRKAEYRDWGWAAFEAFKAHARTPEGAYTSVHDVNSLPVKQLDSLETFWTAETLKYLWLLFGTDSDFSLRDFVLNTEAHPFRVLRPSTARR